MFLKADEISRCLESSDPGRRLEVTPWREDSLGENGSVRLHLGEQWFRGDKLVVQPTFQIAPSEFVIGVTREYISMPSDLWASIEGSGSLGRVGLLVNRGASVVDPGFRGLLTLQLANLGRKPLSLKEDGYVASLRFFTQEDDVTAHEKPEPDESDRRRDIARLHLVPLERELFAYLSRHPEHMLQLSPRKFEEVTAELLRRLSYDVHLTPPVKDGGRDILAYLASPIGKILTLVECKRFSPDRKVGIELVERFLWVVDRKDNAACGLYVTTSSFTAGVYGLQRDHAWRLFLRDFVGLKEWLQQVAEIDANEEGGLWIPK